VQWALETMPSGLRLMDGIILTPPTACTSGICHSHLIAGSSNQQTSGCAQGVQDLGAGMRDHGVANFG